VAHAIQRLERGAIEPAPGMHHDMIHGAIAVIVGWQEPGMLVALTPCDAPVRITAEKYLMTITQPQQRHSHTVAHGQ
jgi:hypothetical protein